MGPEELPSGTVTLLFTDIEGSTALLKQLRDGYGEVLDEHRRLLRAAFAAHGGREIDTQGDAFFVAFARARDGVAAAVDAQTALGGHEWPAGAVVRVRMGIHTGEPVLGTEGYHGLGLHRGARICSAGHGGQILLSNVTRELVEDDLIDGVELLDLGERRLKDIDRPERLAQVTYPGMPASFPPLKTTADTPFEGREEELADEVAARFGWVRRRRRPVALIVGLGAAAAVVAAVLLTGGGDPIAVEPNSLAVLSASGKELKASLPTGTSPGGVAIGEGSVWVTNTGEATVSRIKDNEVVQTIPVGSGPVGVAVNSGFVWVANSLDGTVSQIDPRKAGGAEIGPIRVGNQPTGIAAGDGSVWVANSGDRTLSRIDTDTGRADRPFSAGTGADALAVGEGRVWVTSFAGATVSEVDPKSSRVLGPISVGYGPSAVAVGAGAVWVVNALDGTVSKIDPERSSVVSTLSIGREPQGIAARGNDVWVTDEAGVLTRINARRTTIAQRVELGNRPGALALSADGVNVAVRSSGPTHRGGTLRVSTSLPGLELDGSLDPALAYAQPNLQIVDLLNDGLLAYRRSAGTAGVQIVPDLATSVPNPTDAGRTWTFHLRRGIKYANGETVLASDIRRAIERGFSLKNSTASFLLTTIKGAAQCPPPPRRCDLSRGIQADDAAGTVTFRLTEPDPDFLYKLAYPTAAAVPRSTPFRAMPRGVPGTGPYQVEQLTKKQLTLTRNPRFRQRSAAAQPLPYPDRIELRLGVKPNKQLRMVERGEADVAFETTWASPDKLEPLERQRASQMHVNPELGMVYAFLNTRRAPFADLRVRQAVNLALDRRTLLRSGIPNCQVLPRGFTGYERYCPFPYDPDRARQLVAESGTKGAKVTVWSPPDAQALPLMKGVVRVMQKLGYRARLHVAASLEDHFTTVKTKHEQAGFFGWFPDFPSTAGVIPPLLGCGQGTNLSRVCDRRLDAKMRRASLLQATDPVASGKLWAEIDHALTDQAPWVSSTTLPEKVFVSERVGNFQHNPQWGVLLDQLWVR